MLVMTWNVHGSVDRNGNGNAGSPEKLLPDLLDTVVMYKPDVIGLQELCYKQHRTFKAKLAKLGYLSTMTYVNESGGCNDKAEGNKSGNALYLKTSSIEWRSSAALPYGKNPVGSVGRQPRRILGARMKGSPFVFCVTHLSPGDPDNAEQIKKCVSVVGKWQTKNKVVLFGDFNMNATKLNSYLPGYFIDGHTIDLVSSTNLCATKYLFDKQSSDHPQVLVEVY